MMWMCQSSMCMCRGTPTVRDIVKKTVQPCSDSDKSRHVKTLLP